MTGALLRRDRFLHQETKGSARRKRKYQRCVAMVRSIRAKATRAFRAKSTCAFILLSSARRFSLTSGTLLVLTGQKLELQKLHEQLATLVRLYVISMKHLCARVSAASLPPSPLTLPLPSFFRCADGFNDSLASFPVRPFPSRWPPRRNRVYTKKKALEAVGEIMDHL